MQGAARRLERCEDTDPSPALGKVCETGEPLAC